MSETRTILVAGATGQQGGAVARSLTKRGHRVIGLTRDRSKFADLATIGVTGVQGDLTDRRSLAPLLENVDGFFVVTTPFNPDFSLDTEKEVRQGVTAVDAAKSANVPHVVLATVASADRDTKIPHFESKATIERHLKASRLPFTIMRPVAFMDNYASPWMLSTLRQGTMTVPVPPTTHHQLVAVKDIGEIVAKSFEQPRMAVGKTVELAGEDIEFGQIPQVLSRRLGLPIRYVEQPEDDLRRTMGEDAVRMFRFFRNVGYRVDIAALEREWGYRMTRFQQFMDEADLSMPSWPGPEDVTSA